MVHAKEHHCGCECVCCTKLQESSWTHLDDWQKTIMECWDDVADQLNIQTKACEIEWGSVEKDHIFIDDEEWLVLDDCEATERAEEQIRDSLHCFNSSWLAKQTNLPEKVFTILIDECDEDNIVTLIEATCTLDDFVYNTIGADGRGTYISSYDDEEHEVSVNGTYYYFYRLE